MVARIETVTRVDQALGAAVDELIQDATAFDGVPPVGEHKYLKLHHGADSARGLLAWLTGVLPAGKNIDRWQYITFIPPCFVHIHVGGAETGTGVLEGKVEHGLNFWIINAMTPETAETTNYFWASVRAFALDSEPVSALLFGQVSEAFDEDKQIIEAQQQNISRHGDTWSVALKGDAGSIESRRLLDRLIAAEGESA